MSGVLFLTLAYMRHHAVKTAILVGCLFLTAFLPILIYTLVGSFERSIYARAEATPLVIGPSGSALDLTLSALYFQRRSDKEILHSQVDIIEDGGLAEAIPLFLRFTASDFPIVGTTPAYFRFRSLAIAEGSSLQMLGDCVLGNDVADRLQLSVGDSLLSDRLNMLDLAGEYPLKLKVRGILAPTSTADDTAVLVDIKTAWVIAGVGHGHQNLEDEDQRENVVRKDGAIESVGSRVVPYTEITDANFDSFHFHGDSDSWPVSAIIAVPKTPKNGVLLEGRYRDDAGEVQLVRPTESITELMSVMFRVRQFFTINAMLIGIATSLLTGLVILLSMQLRKSERETMFKLGASRGLIASMQICEIVAVVLLATLAVIVAVAVVDSAADGWFEQWIARGGAGP